VYVIGYLQLWSNPVRANGRRERASGTASVELACEEGVLAVSGVDHRASGDHIYHYDDLDEMSGDQKVKGSWICSLRKWGTTRRA
jgi:hypothetical protein